MVTWPAATAVTVWTSIRTLDAFSPESQWAHEEEDMYACVEASE